MCLEKLVLSTLVIALQISLTSKKVKLLGGDLEFGENVLEIGKLNRLQIVERGPFGAYLDGGEHGRILLPRKQAPKSCELGDELEVFVYPAALGEGEPELQASVRVPDALLGECAYLKVVSVAKFGAFLDWGLEKDLFVPLSEQNQLMEADKSYVVYITFDKNTDRLIGSSKLSKHLEEHAIYFKAKQAVDLLICGRSEMGYKAVVNGTHLGLIFKDEIFQDLRFGQKLKGYIKAIREDKKIDLCLQLPGSEMSDELSQKILAHLKSNGGSSRLSDKSPPEDIYRQFHVSKKKYKKALASLYKQHQILIEGEKISLV